MHPSDERDRALMEGLLLLEESIGPSGYPDELVTGTDAIGAYEVKTFMDYAFEAIEKERKKEHPLGTRFRIVRT